MDRERHLHIKERTTSKGGVHHTMAVRLVYRLSVHRSTSGAQSLPSMLNSMEKSAWNRFTLPSFPEKSTSWTAYMIGWNRVHTALRDQSEF